jgi:hypothetical protein
MRAHPSALCYGVGSLHHSGRPWQAHSSAVLSILSYVAITKIGFRTFFSLLKEALSTFLCSPQSWQSLPTIDGQAWLVQICGICGVWAL